MNIYFDTEFTGLHKNTTLISIGCITDSKDAFYAEFTDYDKSQCDEWIEENVISKLMLQEEGIHQHYNYSNPLGFGVASLVTIKGERDRIIKEFRIWLNKQSSKSNDKIQFVSDVCHYDFVLLIDLFGDALSLPDMISPVCHDINSDIARYYRMTEYDAFDYSREAICGELLIDNEGNKHNALYDADVISGIYRRLKRKSVGGRL